MYVIADNCTGQNKNQTVIHFLLWLMESGYFKKVCLSFLVRGHTKNACDRSFNLMKKRFHKQDIYTYDQLLEVLGQHKQVTMVDVQSDDFEAWGDYLDKFYKRMKPGTVTKIHVFSAASDEPHVLTTKNMLGRGRRSTPLCEEGNRRSTQET